MATWLAYLKSKLLLPEVEEDDFKALEVAERLKLQLKIRVNKNFIKPDVTKKGWSSHFHKRHERRY